jgi:hypothetical protein
MVEDDVCTVLCYRKSTWALNRVEHDRKYIVYILTIFSHFH